MSPSLVAARARGLRAGACAAAVVLSAMMAACSGGDEPAVSQPQAARPLPDILIYLVDTLRADALGTYGATRGDSLAIDALAGQAAVFENAVSQAPWTLPSVTSLLTSSFPPSHRILGKSDRVGPQADTLVEYLKSLGYHTVGFASNTMGGKGAGLDQGFDEFTEHQFLQKPMAEHIAEGSHPLQPLFDWAVADHGDAPLFLYVHTVEPHDPYEGDQQQPSSRFVGTPEERQHLLLLMHEQRRLDAKRFGEGLDANESRRVMEASRELANRTQDVRDLYEGDVRQANDNFAHLIDLLSRSPRWASTVVVFLSDHGEEFHEHDSWFHGQSVYQELLHVPLIMRVPGLTDGGRRIDTTVQLIDVLPTLADLIGGPARPDWQGRSLLPLLRGESLAPAPVYSMRIITDRKLGGARGDSETALIDDGWKLIVHHDLNRASLYDLRTDPGEQHDLANEQPDRLRAMLAQVQQRLRELPVLPIRSNEALDPAAEAQKQLHLEDLGYVERARDH